MKEKILIVDDDIWMTKVLNKIVMNLGYSKTSVAYNGFDAVAIALKENPDLLFLDLMMPDMDGLITLKLLKTIPNTATAKIIICSGNNDMDNLTKAIKLGAADFISKPFTADTIKEKIDLILNKKE
jgi:two-component system chemotaxis response regulator CheY